jgi:hypothetical protein
MLGALYGQGSRINGAKSCILGLSWYLISFLLNYWIITTRMCYHIYDNVRLAVWKTTVELKFKSRFSNNKMGINDVINKLSINNTHANLLLWKLIKRNLNFNEWMFIFSCLLLFNFILLLQNLLTSLYRIWYFVSRSLALLNYWIITTRMCYHIYDNVRLAVWMGINDVINKLSINNTHANLLLWKLIKRNLNFNEWMFIFSLIKHQSGF